jgi:hypothetical protein
MKNLKHGKINLTAFKNSSINEVNGKRCVCIPIDDNHLSENYKNQVYASLVSFYDSKIKPYTHNINLSVPEKFRKENWRIGGFKLD